MSPLKVFVSYAHENVEYKNDLKKHCALFVEDGDIELWTDDAIRAGDKFDDHIKEEILVSDMAILLLSSTYWSKEYIKNIELPLILEQEETRGMVIVPILINGERKIKRTKLNGRSLIPVENNILKAIDDFEDKEKAWDIIYDAIDKKLEDYEKNQEIENNKELKVNDNTENSLENKIPKICIYTVSPLNKSINYDYKKIIKQFSKYNIELYHKVLNENELLDTYDFDYNFVFTKTNGKKIIVEDEFFIQKSISLADFETNVYAQRTILFLDKDFNNTTLKIYKSDEQSAVKVLAAHLHREFNQMKGKFKSHHLSTELPSLIDEATLNNFVGKDTDLENIIKKILTIKDENRILTIKASGGIGKTTIISKAAVEIAKRGRFKGGIKFLQCEYIKDYEEFENKITFAFDMDNARNFQQQLEELSIDENRLIILDNMETLLHIDDVKTIKLLIKLISRYATVILTSREILNEEYEEVYELKPLTSDEAEELFLKMYTIKKYDRKLLREQLLDNYLNNNPLAIKLVTRNLPKGKNLRTLIKELDDNFFDVTRSEIEKVFSEESDLNIERTKSLYQSINYSYQKLTNKEKLALEILSLFPDGMNLENFITFYNKDMKNHKISKKAIKNRLENFSDRDIKTLADKSLIINTNQTISLQSIIGRFANSKFLEKKDAEKIIFYKKAYEYNQFVEQLIRQSNHSSIKARIVDVNKNNFLKSFDYLGYLEKDLLLYKYISNLVGSFSFFSAPNSKIELKLKNLNKTFNDLQSQKFFKVMILYINYFYGEFSTAFNEIKLSFPLDTLLNNKVNKTELDGRFNSRLLAIYSFEGYAFEKVKYFLKQDELSLSDYFLIGEYNVAIAIASKRNEKVNDEFFEFELLLNTNFLQLTLLEKYRNVLYKTEHIEKMQVTYTLLKADENKVEINDIKKLVTINPFTEGLKILMLAIKTEEKNKKEKYEEAIQKLYHIRYYHVEAILIYSQFLKEFKDTKYEKWLENGKELAKKHNYRYLLHQYICLEKDEYTEYDEKNYPLPEKLDYSRVIKKYNLDLSID